jgi:hypothetical protein
VTIPALTGLVARAVFGPEAFMPHANDMLSVVHPHYVRAARALIQAGWDRHRKKASSQVSSIQAAEAVTRTARQGEHRMPREVPLVLMALHRAIVL